MRLLKGTLFIGLACGMISTVLAGDLVSALPESTKIVAKLDLNRLRNSQFYANIEAENLEKIENAQDKLVENIGINPKSVSSVWLAGVKKKEGMLILKGEFDPATIREAISGKPGCQIIDRAGCELAAYCKKKRKSGKILAVILDKNTIALGEPAFVDAFISTFKGNGIALSEDNAEKAKNALGKNVLFQGILLGIPENNGIRNPIASNISGANATLDVTDKITFSADVNMNSNENAKSATQILYGLIAMYEMKQPQNYKGEIVKESLLKNLKIEQDGNDINISGGIGAQVMDQLIDKFN
jgi:hypothetical protein